MVTDKNKKDEDMVPENGQQYPAWVVKSLFSLLLLIVGGSGGGALGTYLSKDAVAEAGEAAKESARKAAIQTESRTVALEQKAQERDRRIERIERTIEKWDTWGERLTRIESKVDILLQAGGRGPAGQDNQTTIRKETRK